MATKKVVKFQKPTAAKKLSVAAAPLKAEPISIKIKTAVDTEDLLRLEKLADRVESAAAIAAVAAESLTKQEDPKQKQLHRRVQVAVYDADGVRMANSEHDLSVTESLTLTVCGAAVTASTTASDR